MNKALFFAIWIILSPCSGQAQEEAPPGNPIRFPNGNSEWSVEFSPSANASAASSNADSAAPRSIKSLQVTQSGTIQRKTITWSDNKVTQNWYFPANQFTITTDTPNGSAACLLDSNFGAARLLHTGFDASAFTWISPANFIGISSYEGKTCYHYKATVPIVVGLKGETRNSTYEAWLDKETLLPVALDDGVKLGKYAFAKEPPKGPLVLPKNIENTFTDYTGSPPSAK